MLFNSVSFIIFFPLFLLVYMVIPKKARFVWLLLSSYFFYMCWNPIYVLILLASTVTTYLAGILLEKFSDSKKKKIFTLVGILVLNLAILFVFKYFNFAVYLATKVFGRLGITITYAGHDLLLPVGISFYIFQAVGYAIDVYRGTIKAEKNFFYYALFVSFFPQLVAGPIERSSNLLPQIRNIANLELWDAERLRKGAILMLYGYFMKLMVADRAAVFVNVIFNVDTYSTYRGFYVAIAAVLFAIQIYCDFAGYTYIAIGTAKICGMDLMNNFKAPYMAEGIKDFWSRWHMSLTGWFKDYLYFPLGGSKKGKVRKCFNIFIVFLISGLWHGAALNYIAWGVYHGVLRIIEDLSAGFNQKVLEKLKISRKNPVLRFIMKICTFFTVTIGWIFFRAKSIDMALILIRNMFSQWNPGIFTEGTLLYDLDIREWRVLLISIAVMVVVDAVTYIGVKFEDLFAKRKLPVRWIILIVGIMSVLIFGRYGLQVDSSQFIYFQF